MVVHMTNVYYDVFVEDTDENWQQFFLKQIPILGFALIHELSKIKSFHLKKVLPNLLFHGSLGSYRLLAQTLCLLCGAASR